MKAYILHFRKKAGCEIPHFTSTVVYGAINYRKIIEYILANIGYEIHTPEQHWWWYCEAIDLDCELANNKPKISYYEPRYFDWNGNEMPYEPIAGYIT